jgi:hypothetical protein
MSNKVYIVHLCDMQDGVYDSYDSTHLTPLRIPKDVSSRNLTHRF